MKPKKQCNHSRCRTLIDYDKKYCKKHKGSDHKKYDATRDEATKGFYNSSRWRNTRKQAMIRDSWLCQRCLSEGLYVQAKIGDHITPIKEDWSRRFDIENIQGLCASCHNIKTAEEETRNVGKP